MDLRSILLLSTFALCALTAIARPAAILSGVYNVDKFGAKGDGKHDDSQAFQAAWVAACADSGSPTIEIPNRKYLVGPLQFMGPCKNTGTLTMKVHGKVLASTNMNLYKSQEWILFAHVDNVKLTGTGTFDGQGTSAWPLNQCPFKKQCKILPVSLKFAFMKNTRVEGITSLNPKFFHIVLLNNIGFLIQNVHITAPGDSPNTDGIHLEGCVGVKILQSDIATGDDCVSVGHGNTDVYVNGINCGPGHGISVGSLGRYSYEKDVSGLVVTGCTLTGTTNGVRIKSWQASPLITSASNMTFENIIMKDVANPIIIDQNYCPFKTACAKAAPSRVKISNIKFSNIRGTSTTPVAVNLQCSAGYPCKNVKVQEINLSYRGYGGPATSSCSNVKASYGGRQVPPPCK
ncbi:exopolygalacturonase-like [Nymphaea colorata]|nr:exopolygalacturonase-like [Nymphaea colorata]